MPRPRPPRTPRAGHVHVAATRPVLPVRPAPEAPSGGLTAPGPLAALARPPQAGDDAVAVQRRLDRGRLYAPTLLASLGWPTPAALDADVSRAGSLRLRLAARTGRSVAGSAGAHCDSSGRIVLTEGLRAHLGVRADGQVFAVAHPGGIVEVVAVGTVVAALARLPLTGHTTSLTASLAVAPAAPDVHPVGHARVGGRR